MHILLIHQAFVALSEPGGTRHYELALHLAKNGHRVTIIASPVSYLTGQSDSTSPVQEYAGLEDRITILRTYTYKALHRSFVHRIFSFISFMISSFTSGMRVKNIDLVWGTSPPLFQGITAWALSRLKRVPFLFEIRDLWPAFAIQVGVLKQPVLIRASEWLERFLYRRADRVIVNSPGFIEHVSDRGARQVELIPNGVDIEMFDPYLSGHVFRQAHGLEGKYVSLYAGAHGMSNDLEILLKAANILKSHAEIAFVLLGDGKDKPSLELKAAEMKLENVHFIPPVPKTQMREALAAADSCIAILKPIPLYATVYPNKVFDYMAAGRPVILSIDGVIREVIENASSGIFTPPGDPTSLAKTILQMADEREKGQEMGLNGRKYVGKHFDRSNSAKKLTDIMIKMVAG